MSGRHVPEPPPVAPRSRPSRLAAPTPSMPWGNESDPSMVRRVLIMVAALGVFGLVFMLGFPVGQVAS